MINLFHWSSFKNSASNFRLFPCLFSSGWLSSPVPAEPTGSCPGQFELIFTCLTPKQQSDHPALLSSFIFKPGPLDKSADLTQCFVIRTIRFHCVGKKCWGHHTSPGRSCETQLGQKLWIILWGLWPSVGSAWSQISLLSAWDPVFLRRSYYGGGEFIGGWFSSGKIFANTQQSCFPDSPHVGVCMFSSSFHLWANLTKLLSFFLCPI